MLNWLWNSQFLPFIKRKPSNLSRVDAYNKGILDACNQITYICSEINKSPNENLDKPTEAKQRHLDFRTAAYILTKVRDLKIEDEGILIPSECLSHEWRPRVTKEPPFRFMCTSICSKCGQVGNPTYPS